MFFLKIVDMVTKSPSKKSSLLHRIKKRTSGAAALEATLTIPVMVMIIFFTLELMKVNNARAALDSMAIEATMNFIATKSIRNFDSIIEKYRSMNVSKNNIKYYFAIYETLDLMCAVPPFGNEEIYWPSGTVHEPTTASFIDIDRNGVFRGRARHPSDNENTDLTNGYLSLSNHERPEDDFDPAAATDVRKTLRGKVFVLTFVCDYKFSSDFIRTLFAGGSNTHDGKHFLIWGRGVGVCN